MNVFEAYAKRANTMVSRPQPLLGPLKLRATARTRYAEIATSLSDAKSSKDLEEYLSSIADELTQYHAELEFLWSGDGDFLGLEKEIEWARARLDAGLDYPRWEVRYEEKETGQ